MFGGNNKNLILFNGLAGHPSYFKKKYGNLYRTKSKSISNAINNNEHRGKKNLGLKNTVGGVEIEPFK